MHLFQPEIAGITLPVMVQSNSEENAKSRFQNWWKQLSLPEKKHFHPEPANYDTVNVVQVPNDSGVVVLP